MLLSEWCETHGEQGQQIKSEWVGEDEYGEKYPFDTITHGSGKKMLWVCSKNPEHKWYAKVMHRTNVNSGCPICSKDNQSKRTSMSKLKPGINDLYTWCMKNQFGKTLINQFVGKSEDGTDISMHNITYGSKQKVFWKCDKEHVWLATVSSRTNTECKCPYCSGNRIIENKNSLEAWCKINNRPDLIQQYMGLDEEGNTISANKIRYASHKKVMWKHYTENGEPHKWFASVRHRTINNSKCPICNSKKILPGFNDLDTWCKNNKPFGDIISEQFSGLDEFGDTVDITAIAPNSYRKIVWMHYDKNEGLHEWKATVYNRTANMSGCPICNTGGTSLPEQLLYRCIRQVYPNTISRGKFQGYEFDITIPELKTCIEYGSSYYHKDRVQRDKEKRELCNTYGVNFISIVHDQFKELYTKEVFSSNLIVIQSVKVDLYNLILKVMTILNIDINKINYEKALKESIEFMKG